jgi:hypothetical protein
MGYYQEYVVKLSRAERERLEALIHKGKSPAGQQTRARILLHADTSKSGSAWNDARVAEALGCCEALCGRVRKQYANQGLEAVLTRKKRLTPSVAPIFDGEKEAKLIALACSPPPAGHAGWSLRLLENRVVDLHIVDKARDNTIGRVLKKTGLSRTSSNNGLSRRSKTARS